MSDRATGDLPGYLHDALIAYDESSAVLPEGDALPSGDKERLQQDMECLDLLRRVWPEPSAASEEPEPPPRELGDFRIVREIGRGGMGVVYEAEQLSLGRRVALKVLPYAAMLEEKAVIRFKNEARAAATLDHPNIVPIHAVGVERGVHYYAMQLIEGASVGELVGDLQRQQPRREGSGFPAGQPDISTRAVLHSRLSTEREHDRQAYVRQVTDWCRQAAESLQHAHEKGVLHRDVKPGNLLIDHGGKLWVADFGLARIESNATLTATGDLVGTLRYMSPEQALGRRVVIDERADVYSLGLTLYELLTLRSAFDAEDRQELLRQIAEEQPTPIRSIEPGVGIDLETVVLKAIEKAAEDRYASAGDFAADLRRTLAGEPIVARRPGVVDRFGRWLRKHRRFAALLTLFLALAAGGSIVSTVAIGDALADAREAQAVAVAERDSAVQSQYFADIRAAQIEWENGNVLAVQKLLDRYVPGRGERDLRGWEWRCLRQLTRGHRALIKLPEWPLACAANPAGGCIAASLGDATLRVWAGPDWKPTQVFTDHESPCTAVAWSPDGATLAALDRSGRLSLRRPTDGWAATTHRLPKHGRWLDWSRDGSRIVTTHEDGQIRVTDSRTGELVAQWRCQSSTAAFSADGREVATLSKAGLQVWSSDSGELLRENTSLNTDVHSTVVAWHPGSEVHPDGRILVTGGWDQRVRVWNADSLSLVEEIDAHRGMVSSIKFLQHGRRFATASRDGSVRTWSDRTWGESRVFRGHTEEARSVSCSGDLLVSMGSDQTLRLWDAENDGRVRFHSVQGSAWRPGRPQYAVAKLLDGDERITIQVTEPSRGRKAILKQISTELGDAVHWQEIQLAWSPDGRSIAAAGFRDNPLQWAIEVFDAETGATVRSLTVEPGWTVHSLRWDPRGERLAFVSQGGGGCRARVVDLPNGSAQTVFDGKPDAESLRWSPTGDLLAVSTSFRQVVLLSTQDWSETKRLKRRSIESGPRTGRLAWSSGGRQLYSATSNGWVVAWEIESGDEVLRFKAHVSGIDGMAMSPDGARLATVSPDRTAKVWSTSGRLLLSFDTQRSHLARVEWSADGRFLAAVGWGNAYIYDAPPLEVLDARR